MRCTWMDCEAEGTKPQLDKYGNEWALLCEAHDRELDEELGSLDPKRLMRAWARAGKHHASREEFKKGVVRGATGLMRFAQAMQKGKRGK